MPLIRYATGDISSITTGNCPCKSILKRLNKIEYRINDRVYLGKNLYININMIDNILFKLKDLIIIFLIRTVISLLVITPIAHMLF